jgi:hypothetical protein
MKTWLIITISDRASNSTGVRFQWARLTLAQRFSVTR